MEGVMNGQKEMEKELNRINALIKEAEARLGAHSVKPVLMQQLFEKVNCGQLSGQLVRADAFHEAVFDFVGLHLPEHGDGIGIQTG